MPFVADASVSLRWLLPSQTDNVSLTILRQAEHEGLFVPALWHIEVANQLNLRFRAGKLSRADYYRAQHIIANLDIQTSATFHASPLPILALMESYRLTAYDAIYLEHALTHRLSLASFDQELVSAARKAGVTLLI